MLVPTGVSSRSVPTEVSNLPGAFTGDHMDFTPWQAVGWHDQWTPDELQLWGDRFSDFGGTQSFAFTMTESGRPARVVGCREKYTRVPGTTTFEIRCTVWSADRATELAVLELVDGQGGALNYEEGELSIVPVLLTESGRAADTGLGYQITGPNGDALAAVQTRGRRAVWIPSEGDAEQRADVACVAAALVNFELWAGVVMSSLR